MPEGNTMPIGPFIISEGQQYFLVPSKPLTIEDPDTMQEVLKRLLDKRYIQDLEWGGMEHDDDNHALMDWVDFIAEQRDHLISLHDATPSKHDPGPTVQEVRNELESIGALAIAALQSLERLGEDFIYGQSEGASGNGPFDHS